MYLHLKQLEKRDEKILDTTFNNIYSITILAFWISIISQE
jgi:hypothetical protein